MLAPTATRDLRTQAMAPGDLLQFGDLLRRYRLTARLTQEELAERATLSAKGIGALERGERQAPHRETVWLLVDALGLSGEEREEFEAAARRHATRPAATAPPDFIPTNLPVAATPFIGREVERFDVRGWLLAPDVRLLTLTGAGGTGKTRLALKVAEDILDQFPDGVYFVSLAPITDAELVLPAVATALEVVETGTQPLLESIKTRLHGRRMLLVLDNFEQVLDAAPVIPELLGAPAVLTVLVTSRAALRIRGEQEYPVQPLSLPDLTHLPEIGTLGEYDAVELFVRRAQARKPDFQLTDENARAVAEICYRLDGLPLAIELAAARIKLLSPEAMLRRWGGGLALLTGGARDVPARQKTLRSTIDWSYNLLNDEERTLFGRLGVFAGGCTLEAAEKVCGEGGLDVLEGIGALVDNSLLKQEEGAGGETRLRMLETIREYAIERLETSGELAAVRERHAKHYLNLATQAFSGIRGSRQVEWLARLDREHDNLRAALSWSLACNDQETFAGIGWGIWLYWFFHGHLSEGGRWIENALARGGPMSKTARARLNFIAGILALTRTEYMSALPLLEESLALFHETGDTLGRGYATGSIGMVQLNLGRYEQGLPLLEQAIPLHREASDSYGQGVLLATLSVGWRQLGDLQRARQVAAEGLALARQVGERHSAYMALCNLAAVAYTEGDHDQATQLLSEALSQSVEMMELGSIAYCLRALGMVASARGQLIRAVLLWGAAETVLGSGEPGTLPHVADQSLYEQSLAAARAQLDEATWTASWSEGRAMTTDEAIACALNMATAP